MKDIKEKIKSIIGHNQNIAIDDIVEVLLPEFDCKPEILKRKVLKQSIRNVFASIKDSDGVREFLSYEDADKNSIYAKITGNNNPESLKSSINKMKMKVMGMNKSISKAERQLYLITNQYEMVFDQEKNEILPDIKLHH